MSKQSGIFVAFSEYLNFSMNKVLWEIQYVHWSVYPLSGAWNSFSSFLDFLVCFWRLWYKTGKENCKSDIGEMNGVGSCRSVWVGMSESFIHLMISQTLTSQVFQVLSGQNKESISITFFLTKCAAHKYQNARQKYVA